MPSAPRLPALGLALLAVAALSAFQFATLRFADNLWWELALAWMAIFALARRFVPPVRAFAESPAVEAALLGGTALCWAAFWLIDLRRAQFQQVLWTVPACAVLLLLTRLASSTPRHAPLPWLCAFALILLGPQAAIELHGPHPASKLVVATAALALFWLAALGFHAFRLPRASRRPSWRAGLAGGLVGLDIAFALAGQRSENGCTGISSIYTWTLEVTLVALFSVGPAALSRLLEAEA
jgi:hypothetical protein